MANQQVDKALNDYFSDLLGDASNASIAELPSEPKTEAESCPDKQVLKEESLKEEAPKVELPLGKPLTKKTNIAKADQTTTIESPVKAVEQQERCHQQANKLASAKNEKAQQDVKQASSKGLSSMEPGSNIADSITAGLNSKPVGISSANYAAPNSSPKMQKLDEVQPFAGSSSYKEHKKKLEKMLQQVTAFNTASIADTASVASTDVSTKTQVETDTTKTAELEPAIAIEVTAESSEIADSEAFLSPILSSQWNDNGRPEWAQNPFDILLLEVNGLQLAVPLVALGQIQEIEEEITPLFGQSEWFMGLQKTLAGNIKVVNTAQFIMPERYKDQHDYKYVISITGLQWGLAVDSINQPISIDPGAIRWRVKRESRPWMAGMVKDHMCVLLDIPRVGEILQAQDKNRVD